MKLRRLIPGVVPFALVLVTGCGDPTATPPSGEGDEKGEPTREAVDPRPATDTAAILR